MGREEWLLTESIIKQLERAEDALRKVDILEGHGAADPPDPHDDSYERATEALAYYIEGALRSIGALSERLGIQSITQETIKLRADRMSLKQTTRPFDFDIHSEPLSKAHSCFEPLQALTEARAVTAQDVLRTILRSSGKISSTGTVPTNEADVRNAVLAICQFAFNDAMRETPTPKRITSYRIDLTVRSLRSAVEFKFIDDKSEMRAALEGVYADIKGYKDPNWDSFYSVFYMTGPFYTQEEIDEEFRYVDVEKSWEPIVVVGPGARIKKPKKSAKKIRSQ